MIKVTQVKVVLGKISLLVEVGEGQDVKTVTIDADEVFSRVKIAADALGREPQAEDVKAVVRSLAKKASEGKPTATLDLSNLIGADLEAEP